MRKILFALSLILTSTMFCAQAADNARIKVFTELDNPYILSDSGQNVVLKVGFNAEPNKSGQKRLPLNVAVVLDKSGSMGSDGKIEKAKQGVIEIIEQLNEGDIISVVVYDTAPYVLVPAQPLRDKEGIVNQVSQIGASGSTALYGGVELGAEELRKHSSDYRLNKIILLSDGLANVGPQSTEDLVSLGRMLNGEDVIVSTIGVGLDYNEDLMTALAGESGGNSYFAQNGDELPKIFAEEINEAMTIAAKDIKVRVDTMDGARPLSIIGRSGEIKDNHFAAEVSALYGKNEKYALFEMQVPQGRHGESKCIANVHVEYTDPQTNKTIVKDSKVKVEYNKDQNLVFSKQNKGIVKETVLTRTSEIKNQAIKLADKGDYKAAAQYINDQSVVLEKTSKQCNNDVQLKAEAEQCKDLIGSIFSNKGFSRQLRKAVTSDAYSQTNQQAYDPGKNKK